MIFFIFYSFSYLYSQEKNISITLQSYKEWANAFKIENESIKLIVVTDIGPRILYFAKKNGNNVFHEIEYSKEQLQENTWKNYGGHRLWIAPEDKVITYQPDNRPATVEIKNNTIKIIQKEDSISHTVKELEIRVHSSRPFVEVTHRIINKGKEAIELSAWALSVLRKGGIAYIPLGKKGKHPENLLPNYTITLWPYTNLSDSCFEIDSDFIRFYAREKCRYPQKIGSSGEGGWLSYLIEDTIFLKAYKHNYMDTYPDRNSSAEIFSNGRFIELETLSPLRKIKPNASIEYTEYWMLEDINSIKMNLDDISKTRLELIDSFK